MKGYKILIVDDEELVLSMLDEILEEEGIKTDKCLSMEEALEMLAEHSYDLVISDVRMPGKDGFELLNHVKENCKDTPVIMMTGYTEDYDISDVLVLGADDYITKPFDADRIIQSVNNILKE